MLTLLVIEASPRGEYSISRELTARFATRWASTHPHGRIVRRDLSRTDIPFVTLPWVGASVTPLERQTPEMREALRLSDELVDEFLAADHIAIGTPVYIYNVPAKLKAYIDQIVRPGRTLGEAGEGLVRGKTCTVLMASGGIYTDGSPIRDRDIATAYLRLILRVIGIDDVTFVSAGGTKVVDLGNTSRDAFLQPYDAALTAAATG